jgi:hypothetical protein
VLNASIALDPQLTRLYTNLRPIIRKAPIGFPSLRGFLDNEAPRLLGRLPDYLAELNPLVQTVGYYRRELTAFLANVASATNARASYPSNPNGVRYVRAGVTLGPESLTAFNQRLLTNRSNPYPLPGSNLNVASSGLQVFDDSNCTTGLSATLPDWAALTPAQQAQYQVNLRYPFTPAQTQQQYEDVQLFAFDNQNLTDNLPAPPCIQQPLSEPIGDPSKPATQYQQVFRQP